MAMIEAQRLTKTYQTGEGPVHAIHDVSLSLDQGEFIALQGPSGCGKTTFLLIAGALLRPDGGALRVNEQDPYALSPDARAAFRAETIGFVFQQFYLIPYLTVLENVLCPSAARRSPDAPGRAAELVDQFSLSERAHHTPGRLSTGERQRVAMARALLNDPKIILADEPTGNLDEDNARVVLNSLREFAHSGGTVLMVSHNTAVTQTADRTIHLHNGSIAQE